MANLISHGDLKAKHKNDIKQSQATLQEKMDKL